MVITPSHRFRLRDPNPAVREAAALSLVFAPNPDYLPELIALLGDADSDVRRTALQALGALNDPTALDGIREALLDPVLEVADAAQAALVKLGSSSLSALEAWLEHPEWPQRAAALRGLSQLQSDPQRFVPLCHDAIWEVRGEAYLALGRSQSQTGLQALLAAREGEQHPQAREALLAGLGEISHPDAGRMLLQAFLDPSSQEAPQAVAAALQHYGEMIHAPLLGGGIWSPHPEVRALSAALLAQTGCRDLRNQLAPLLLDRSPQVRQTVAFAIYEAEPTQPIWEFVAGLYHEDDHVFEAALLELLAYPGAGAGLRLLEALDVWPPLLRSIQLVRALGELRYEPAGHVLIELLDSQPEADLLQAICWSLGRIGSWRGWHPLQRMLGHADAGVRHAAVEALIELDPENPNWQQLSELASLSGEALSKLLGELVRYPEIWPLLQLELYQHPDPAFRSAVLEAMRQAPPERLPPILGGFLERWPQPQAETVDALLELLEHAGLDEGLARSLLSWIEQREAPVRDRVSRLLRPWAGTLREELLAAATHDIWFVRQAALKTLGSLPDPEVIAALREALDDRDRDVRITAISLLSRLSEVDVSESLLEALENGYRDIRAAAARALGRRKDAWARQALETALLEDEAPEVRQAAAESLLDLAQAGKIGRDDAIEALSEAFDNDDDPEVQASCLDALYSLDAEGARKYIARALKDEDESLVSAALRLWAQAGWSPEPVMRSFEQLLQHGSEPQQAQALALLLPLRPDLLATWLESAGESLRLACLQAIQPAQVQEHQIALSMLLDDPSPRIRQQTLHLLAQLPELRPMLANRARQEEDPSVLQTLVELLTDLPVSEVLPVYQEILERPTPHVHTSVVWALAPLLALGGGALLQSTLPQAGPGMRSQIFQVLARSGETALPILADLIEHWDRDLVLRAIRALGAMGEPAVPLLEAIWKREELAQQLAVLSACEQLRLPATLPMLILAARSTHDNLRAHAIEALIQLGDAAREGLIQLLQDHDAQIRFDACHALARLEPDEPLWHHLKGSSSALPSRRLRHLVALQCLPVAQWLRYAGHLRKDPAFAVRSAFCETRSEEPAFRRWLLRTLQVEVLPVRQRAALALSELAAGDEPALQQELGMQLMSCWAKAPPGFRECLLAALARLGITGQAMQGLEDDSALVRLSAACVAGSAGLAVAAPQLMRLLTSEPHWEVRAACAWALGRLQAPESLGPLKHALADGHPAVEYQAILAIADLPVPEAGLLLAQLLERHNWDVILREEALRAVSRLRIEAAVPTLLHQLNQEGDLQIRRRILDSLARIGSPSALGYLRELAAYGGDRLSGHAQTLLENLI